jgi:RNA polymerase-binding transcription factor DksA
MSSMLRSSSFPRGSEPPPRAFFDAMRAALIAARDEIRHRHHEISVERVAEAYEQSAILSRNEVSAREIERDRAQLRGIKCALERLDTGEYGICGHCTARIPEKRLRAVPTAEYCIRCQEHIDEVARMDARDAEDEA